MAHTPVHSDQAPRAIGPYSQGVSAPAGRLTFVSGQIALDPRTGELLAGDVTAQTERVMENLGAVLRAASLGFQDVVRCTIFLTDLSEFAAVNAVYGRYFPGAPPARVTVQVSALPRGARVEIDAIAVG
ncbi:MAG TPA: RidA family protein [Myxococcaceae bacterium]|jgi:2-iminobutanoate/2-iminopropanoate deaminase|nr:RidA family protein [Myxococcaceae bacterium]